MKGWVKFFKGEHSELYKERANICMECPHAVDSVLFEMVGSNVIELPGKKCDVCGCALQAKLQVEDEKCPKGKW